MLSAIQYKHLLYFSSKQYIHTYIGSLRICEPCIFRCHQGHKGVRLIKESPVQCNCGEVCAVVADSLAKNKEDAYCKACVISKKEKKVHPYTLIHTYIHTYIHTHSNMRSIHTHTVVPVCIYVCIHIYTYIHTYIHTFIHAYIHTYIHTFILPFYRSLRLRMAYDWSKRGTFLVV